MASKKFCDDKILRILLYIQLIGGILIAYGYDDGMLPWAIRGVCIITTIAFTLLIQSQYRSQRQIILVCAGLTLNYMLQAIAVFPSIRALLSVPTVTVQGKLLVLRFALFVVILLAQAVVYLSYASDIQFMKIIQKLLRTKWWLVGSFMLIVAYFIISIYLAITMCLFSQERGVLSQVIGSYIYLWLQDIVSRGLIYYTYFRSITWYKHVGKIESSEA